MVWPDMRRRSFLLGGTGVAIAVLLWWALAAVVPAPGATTPGARLAVAVAFLLPAVLVLWLMVLGQMGARFAGAVFDPLAGRETAFLRVNQRTIANTVEQLAIFAPALLALAARTAPERMPQVLALALVFALARLVFWIGYLFDPFGRAPGMAGTLFATTAALLAAAWAWLP